MSLDAPKRLRGEGAGKPELSWLFGGCQSKIEGSDLLSCLIPISANLTEDLRSWVGFLSRRDFTIVARYEVPGMDKKYRPFPDG
jgi:hypothetical protein